MALENKTNNTAAKQQITYVQLQIAKEQRYQTAMKQAQPVCDRKDYAEAITQAGLALENKTKDPAATKLRTDAKQQLELENMAKAKEQKYQTAMRQGQAAFDKKDYAEAITQAGVALENRTKDPA